MSQIDLRKVQSLAVYSNTELRILANVAPAREFAAGHVLCREGMTGQSCFLLATGSVNVVKRTEDGDRNLATLRGGQIVGQMALVDKTPRSASVVAAEPTVALELTRDVFEGLLHARNPLAVRFQEQIAIAGIRQLRMATERLRSVIGKQQQENEQHKPPAQAERTMLEHMQAALEEWDMDLDDLDKVQVVVPAGQVTQLEARNRTK
jgi:CRP-like cAMP-binding protein